MLGSARRAASEGGDRLQPGSHTRVGDDAFEIGYWICASRVGQGLATEAVAAVTRVAFELCGVDRLEIHVDPANKPSCVIPRKLGYTEEATLRRRLVAAVPGTGRRDEVIFTLLAEEFPESPSAAFALEAYDSADNRLL